MVPSWDPQSSTPGGRAGQSPFLDVGCSQALVDSECLRKPLSLKLVLSSVRLLQEENSGHVANPASSSIGMMGRHLAPAFIPTVHGTDLASASVCKSNFCRMC